MISDWFVVCLGVMLWVGLRVIWIYVGLVRDVCGLCRVGFGWFVVCPFVI